ncbi:pimeloyl-ACP methyl ester carboxylesterase [Humitalea rosea]|uniref:Pimeloyl-ACP methyl ester carboxylesterase n=2 Tax=Humitalea rosea TaxID=990373 RepID=A0A2W7IT57_9PROT|nr:pimeloyl-ACP methyl ester carboxylesterase [Humitalea rosea]
MIHPMPLLLLPGLLCDDALWAPIRPAIAHLAAPMVADLTQDASIPAMAMRALAQAPPRFALVGLSMGGYVAFEILRQAPERVTRLALFDTSARPDTPEQSRRRRGLIGLARTGQFRGVTPRLLPQLIHPRHADGPIAAEVLAMAGRVGRDAFLRQQEAILARPDSRPMLPGLSLPTLVAVGAQDILTPPELAEEMAALIPGAQLRMLPDCGHLPPMESPAAAGEVLREWLAA